MRHKALQITEQVYGYQIPLCLETISGLYKARDIYLELVKN